MKKKISILLLVLLAVLLSLTSAVKVSDKTLEVEQETEVTYYLHVRYDGVDRDGIESSDSVTSMVYSNYIYVEDRIPDGLYDISIVQTEDGSIGAKDSEGNLCAGEVVGGVNGINVDTTNNIVSFQVYGLKAGCTLDVGIKATVPKIPVGTRKDFFNIATATEGIQTAISNIVHIWTGSPLVNTYRVIYEYVGDVPTGATPLPGTTSYASGNTVRVMGPGVAEGYTFDGWHYNSETGDIVDNTFTMPSSVVTLYGKFNKIDESEKKKVTYKIVGDYVPEGYVVPKEKTYFKDSVVNMDSLKKGDVFNGYRFLGWNIVDSEDIGVTNDENGIPRDFVMPDRDVVIEGSWELVTYSVSYEFMGVMPPNAADLLPETQSYRPGTTVTTATKESVTNPTGYKFLGWYKEASFKMPEEDIVIYGEWAQEAGTFVPEITKTVVDKKDFYQPGDVVRFEIVVKNNESYPINEVFVVENTEKAMFEGGENYLYEVEDPHIAFIQTMEANSAVTLYSTYTVGVDDKGLLENEVELLGAIADNNNVMDPNGNYIATAEFELMGKVKLCKNVTNAKANTKFQFRVTSTEGFESYIVLEPNTCVNTYLVPGNYSIEEIVPQEYKLFEVTGTGPEGFKVTSDNTKQTVNVESGQIYNLNYTNNLLLKPYYHSFGRVENRIG